VPKLTLTIYRFQECLLLLNIGNYTFTHCSVYCV